MYLLISIDSSDEAKVIHHFDDEQAAKSALARCEERFISCKFKIKKVESFTFSRSEIKINFT